MPEIPPPAPIRQHRPGVWTKESWLRFSGITLQTRMVVLCTKDGLVLYSPTPARIDEIARTELGELGEPRFLVAPNEIHNVGLAPFQAAFPEAHTTGCSGHPRRVRRARFDTILGPHSTPDSVPWTRSGELEVHVIGGNAFLHEIAVYHQPSRTLVLTDAVENITWTEHSAPPGPNALLRHAMGLFGFREGAPCMSPEHHLFAGDPDALAASLERLERWDFDSLVIAHGRNLEGEAARRAVRDSFTATIEAARARPKLMRRAWGLVARVA